MWSDKIMLQNFSVAESPRDIVSMALEINKMSLSINVYIHISTK